MQTRTRTATVVFERPFLLQRVGRELPAGAYDVETDEEVLAATSGLAYRRTAVRLFVPSIFGKSDAEMWTLPPDEFDDAFVESAPQLRAAGFTNSGQFNGGPSAHDDRRKRKAAMITHSDLPIYGALIGVLVLLLASGVLGT